MMKTHHGRLKKSAAILSLVAAVVVGGIGVKASRAAKETRTVAEKPYVLHEWGTFTTVSGSDGVLLPGLQREEERLPYFVHAHAGMRNQGPGNWPLPNGRMMLRKGFARPLENVFVKMETPVIYFYSDEGFKVNVEVGFNGGSISQWYPQRSAGETPPPLKFDKGKLTSGAIDFAEHYDGAIAWDVEVLARNALPDGATFKPGEMLNWVYPRQTDANLIRTAQGEIEKYLFYRGVGKFDLPLQTTVDASGKLHLRNNGAAEIPGLLLFNFRDDGKVSFSRLSPLGGGDVVSMNLNAMKVQQNWQSTVYEATAHMLTDAGLYRKEADAMIQTWWNSYFAHRGLRIFWVVPESFTDKILPLKAHPAPESSVRVLVGRSEVLTPAFESTLLGTHGTEDWNRWGNDRFGLAYAARVEALKNPGKPKVTAAVGKTAAPAKGGS